jgi:hypothetical protein
MCKILGEKFKKEAKKGTILISRNFEIPNFKAYQILAEDKLHHWPVVYFYKV